MAYVCKMAAIQLLLLLACAALSLCDPPVSRAELEAEAEAAAEAEAEAAGAAEIERALGALQAALADAGEPLAKRLDAARASLAPLMAALEAHAATLVLHTGRRLQRLQPALQEKLDAAQATLAHAHQEILTGLAERGGAALSEAAAAVARAREQLTGVLPANTQDLQHPN